MGSHFNSAPYNYLNARSLPPLTHHPHQDAAHSPESSLHPFCLTKHEETVMMICYLPESPFPSVFPPFCPCSDRWIVDSSAMSVCGVRICDCSGQRVSGGKLLIRKVIFQGYKLEWQTLVSVNGTTFHNRPFSTSHKVHPPLLRIITHLQQSAQKGREAVEEDLRRRPDLQPVRKQRPL